MLIAQARLYNVELINNEAVFDTYRVRRTWHRATMVTARPPAPTEAARRERLRAIIADIGLIRAAGESFTLASGKTSPFFFDIRVVALHPEGAALIAASILERLEGANVDAVGGIELGAVPIVSAVAALSWPARPLAGLIVRKTAKERGTRKEIEGRVEAGARVVLVEDVTTTGGSVMQAARAFRTQGCSADRVITVVDRLEGAADNLAAEGLALESLYTREDFAP